MPLKQYLFTVIFVVFYITGSGQTFPGKTDHQSKYSILVRGNATANRPDSLEVPALRTIPNDDLLKSDPAPAENTIYRTATFSLNITSFGTTCTASNGKIIITPQMGTPPYLYSLNGAGFKTTGYFLNLTAGSYNILVKDNSGAIANTTVILNNIYTAPTAVISSFSQPTGCNNQDGVVVIKASGGTAPYLFSDDFINYQTSNTFNKLTPNWFTFYVKDANGCLAPANYGGIGLCDLGFGGGSGSSSCNSPTGYINISQVYGGKAPYVFSLDGIIFQDNGNFTGLPPGIHILKISDSTGKISIYSFAIRVNCALQLSVLSANAACNGNDGSLILSAANGVPPYLYSLDGLTFQSSGLFQGLASGSYSGIVKDASGNFEVYDGFQITSGCLSVTGTATGSSCNKNNGSISVKVSDGSAPYQYSIDQVNYQSGNIFNSLSAGDYQVTVKDAMGIFKTSSVTVPKIDGPSLEVNTIEGTCTGSGSLSLIASGGTAPYLFSIDSIKWQTGNAFTSLPDGLYKAYVKDANACAALKAGNLISTYCLKLTSTITNEDCGNHNGQIKLIASGGEAPYEYTIDGGIFQSADTFSLLGEGTYLLTVRDSRGTSQTISSTVKSSCISAIFETAKSSCGYNNGSISITVKTGNPPFQFSLNGPNNFQTNNIYKDLAPGTYKIFIKDAASSSNSFQVVIDSIPVPRFQVTSVASSCVNNDGELTIKSLAGVSPFQYSINNTALQQSPVFRNLVSDNYTLLLKDSLGCVASDKFFVAQANNLVVDAGQDITACEGTDVLLTAKSNALRFTWTSNNSVSMQGMAITVRPLVTTTYHVLAITNNCQQSDSVTVSVLKAPIADAGADGQICFGTNYQMSGSGGVTYSWTPSTFLSNAAISGPTVIRPSKTIIYQLNVTDNNGCNSIMPAQVTINVQASASISAGRDTLTAIGQPLQLHASDENNSGFISYAWTPVTDFNNPSLASPVAIPRKDITYTVTARTAAGCEAVDQVAIKVYKGPEIYVPNSFTPNSDGHNDLLKAIPVGLSKFSQFSVYNRWGQQVFHTNDPSEGWNGKLGGKEQDTGTYTWLAGGLDLNNNPITRKGFVILVR